MATPQAVVHRHLVYFLPFMLAQILRGLSIKDMNARSLSLEHSVSCKVPLTFQRALRLLTISSLLRPTGALRYETLGLVPETWGWYNPNSGVVPNIGFFFLAGVRSLRLANLPPTFLCGLMMTGNYRARARFQRHRGMPPPMSRHVAQPCHPSLPGCSLHDY